MEEQAKNCRNCGAPLNEHGDCEYCGTKSPREWHSGIEITASHIVFYADDRAIESEIVKRMGMGT